MDAIVRLSLCRHFAPHDLFRRRSRHGNNKYTAGLRTKNAGYGEEQGRTESEPTRPSNSRLDHKVAVPNLDRFVNICPGTASSEHRSRRDGLTQAQRSGFDCPNVSLTRAYSLPTREASRRTRLYFSVDKVAIVAIVSFQSG
jgi:hypothetical protein